MIVIRREVGTDSPVRGKWDNLKCITCKTVVLR